VYVSALIAIRILGREILFSDINYWIFFITKHLKKEREKEQIHKEINKISRSEAKNK